VEGGQQGGQQAVEGPNLQPRQAAEGGGVLAQVLAPEGHGGLGFRRRA
jgi:hypothetical protein